MKKVILTGVALMAFAAAGFAQNITTAVQVGNTQTLKQTQAGADQTSNVEQKQATAAEFGGNYAETFQGTLSTPATGPNTINIKQNAGSQGNRAGADQAGANNLSNINQNGGTGTTSGVSNSPASIGAASGTGNFAGTMQNGTYGEANINQNNGSQSNKGEIRQVGNGVITTKNVGTINQSDNSTGNLADIVQGTMGAAVNGNTATVNQLGSVIGASTGNKATVMQTSNGNEATVNQKDASTDNEAAVMQSGVGLHKATVNQNGSAGFSSNNNKAQVGQSGTGNDATVNQLGENTDGTGFGDSFNNDAFVTQSGQNNKATVNQKDNSHDNTATILQAGGGATVGDMATINQVSETADNKATIDQGPLSTGLNEATIDQTAAYATGGLLGNTATINQNKATAGGDNKATIKQGLAGSTSNISSANLAITNQEGTQNVATTIQVGDQNTTTVDQSGNKNESFAEAFGNGNLINIDQVSTGGTGNRARVTMQPDNGTGNDNNNIKIDQNGTINTALFDIRAANSSLPATPNFSVKQVGRSNYSQTVVRNVNNSNSGTPGMDNKVVVDQESAANAANGQAFNAGIQGNRNDVAVKQSGGLNNTGDNNNAGDDIFNAKGLRIIGDDNIVKLTQDGSQNKINMRIGSTGALGNTNNVTINQAGDNNQVGTGVTPDAMGDAVTNGSPLGLYITGENNLVDIAQDGGDEVKATQDGNDKLVVKQQNGMSTAVAQSNRVLISQGAGAQDADITQNGNGNFVNGLSGRTTFAEQKGGFSNKALVNQTSSGILTNELQLSQTSTGVLNTANVTQVANTSSNLATVDQMGTNNLVTVVQTGN